MPAYLPITKRRVIIECVIPISVLVVLIGIMAFRGVASAQRDGIPERAPEQACPTWPDLYYYPGTVVNVVDADTLDVDIYLGLNITKHERIRLWGIDAWEVRGEEREKGLAAKAYVEEWLFNGNPEIRVKTRGERGKYGRLIADIVECGQLLSEHLVLNGHAEYVEY